MLDIGQKSGAETVDAEWPERCRYWQSAYQSAIPTRKRRERQKSPLILTGQGVSIRVDKGALLVRDGFTHHPQGISERRFFKGSLDLPERMVLLDGSGSLTLDALDWLEAEGVTLIRLKWDGRFVSALSAGGSTVDIEKLDWQRQTRSDPKARIAYAQGLLSTKAQNTLETLRDWVPESPKRDRAIETIENLKARIDAGGHARLNDVLGLEGSIAASYFSSWQALPLRWKGTSRNPIPDDWRVIFSRAALRDEKHRNQSATHPVNAMLNYAYGMLMARKQIDAIANGYDVNLGIVHDRRTRDRGKTPCFALDLMEPERPIIDRAIIGIIREHTFSPADFTVTHKGTVKVNPELARVIAREAVER